jgi:branched-chain amino acid transport system permease protein
MLKSIRDDDVAAQSLGKDIRRARIQVMVIGSAFAGVAGALFTYYSNYVSPDNFIPIVTFNVWLMIVLGGLGNNQGTLLGTFLVVLLQKILAIFAITAPIANGTLLLNYLVYVLEGIIFLLLLVFRPKGLLVEKPVQTPADEVLLDPSRKQNAC